MTNEPRANSKNLLYALRLERSRHIKKVIKFILVIGVLGTIVGLTCFIGDRKPLALANEEKETIKLPRPSYQSNVSVEEALLRRRSIRHYAEKPLTLTEISQLLWAAQGITQKEMGFRTAPSAGATFPMETYLVAGEVKGLKPGVYHYQPKGHTLTLKLAGDKRGELCKAALDQDVITDTPISLVFAANYSRTTRRYGERGKRYVYMEMGHIGQNVHLQAEALGLGTVVIGAFKDEQIKKVLGGIEEEPLYIMPVGWKIE